ncbi:MAG: aldehyde dehydrogenase [Acidimicrobiales bacterium]
MTVTIPESPPAQLFIDGSFSPAQDGETFEVVTPSNGQHLVDVASASESDVRRAVESARGAFESGVWSRKSPAERKEILLEFVGRIQGSIEELAVLDSADAGRPITETRGFDIPDAAHTIGWYAEATDKVFGKISPSGEDNLGLIVREPVGVVGAVLPWNFPAGVLAWKLGPALAAGNSIVVKPPELAPLSTLRLAQLAFEAGIPPGVFNVVPGLGHIAGRALGLSGDVDAVTFTGSTEVGREFLRYAADSNLKRVVLELGGKSPQVVMTDVRPVLGQVAENLANAIFFAAGQNCTAGSRIIISNEIRDEFTDLLAQQAESYVVGDSLEPATTLGPLIEPSAVDRVERYVEQAKTDGAHVVVGGARALKDSGGNFFQPTVVTDVSPASALARDEIFGPVVAVLGFDTEAEAIRLANDTTYGLAATVWSKDLDTALRSAKAIRAGTVAVNGYSEGDITTPFGGYRQSGFGGRDNGLEAFDQYTELKTIWISLG